MRNPAERRRALQLVMFAASVLYFELAIIRFTAAEVLYLGYFSNFILITAFVGLGVGFLSERRGLVLDYFFPLLLLFIFALVLVSEFDVNILRNHFGLFFFGNVSGRAGLPGAVLLVVLFLAVAAFFAALGARVAAAFSCFAPLQAYTLDIAGSLFGIVLFTIQSLLSAGPVVWVVTGALLACIAWLSDRSADGLRKAGWFALSALCVVVMLLSADKGIPTVWSMYQKLTVRITQGDLRTIYANGILHQYVVPADIAKQHYYGVPYQLARKADSGLQRVLIIGAGTGTDVAVALRYGADSIDAVEIDGSISALGRMLHPDHPFNDPRVHLHITDGRKFLHDDRSTYNLVVFALPDSLTQLSPMSSIRLESYLFTVEAFESVKAHLAPDGIFVMYNQYRWPWLVNKIAATVRQVFGRSPLVLFSKPDDTTLIAVGRALPESDVESGGFERLAADDWPFLYMQRPGIHWLYLGMIAVFLSVSALAVALLAPRGTLRRPDYEFFFMGMAFMLLETKSLAFFSLLFGTTWMVNAFAFAGILLSVLAANLLVQQCAIRGRAWLFGALFTGLAIAYAVPTGVLLGVEPAWMRYLCATGLAFAPIFFANLVFSREFRDTEAATRAFGWNLLGAVAGGGMEYLSLVLGYRNLIWVVALCYAISAYFARRRAAVPA